MRGVAEVHTYSADVLFCQTIQAGSASKTKYDRCTSAVTRLEHQWPDPSLIRVSFFTRCADRIPWTVVQGTAVLSPRLAIKSVVDNGHKVLYLADGEGRMAAYCHPNAVASTLPEMLISPLLLRTYDKGTRMSTDGRWSGTYLQLLAHYHRDPGCEVLPRFRDLAHMATFWHTCLQLPDDMSVEHDRT